MNFLKLAPVLQALFLLRCPAAATSVEVDLHLADRGHSLASLYLPPAVLGLLPSYAIPGNT